MYLKTNIPHHESLLTKKNVATFPDKGSTTYQTILKMSQIAGQNLLNAFEAKEHIYCMLTRM